MNIKQLLLVNVCVFITLSLSAQKFSSIDIVTGLDYSFRSLSADGSAELDFIIETRNIESGKLNSRFGFNINMSIADQLIFKTGIRFVHSGYVFIETDDFRWPSEHDGNGNWTSDPKLPHDVKLTESQVYFGIPLAIRKEFGKSKFNSFIELGLTPSYYITSVSKVSADNRTTTTTQRQDYNDVQLVGTFAIGANYQITDNFQIFGQASYRYHLNTIVDAPIKEHHYNYGIELGIRSMLIHNKEKEIKSI